MTGAAITRHDTLPDGARTLRMQVFVAEQGIAEALELDGSDDAPGWVHWLAEEDGAPVSTLRTRIDGGVLKIGRVATARSARGRGLSARLLAAALEAGRAEGATRAYLSAQEPVVPFYARHGFAAEGAPYDDAGIPHLDMWRDL